MPEESGPFSTVRRLIFPSLGQGSVYVFFINKKVTAASYRGKKTFILPAVVLGFLAFLKLEIHKTYPQQSDVWKLYD